MIGFDVLERGTLPDGRPYRIARRRSDGWTRAWVGDDGPRGVGRKKTVRWLREQLAGAPARDA